VSQQNQILNFVGMGGPVWAPCHAPVADAHSVELARFGHTSTRVTTRDGSETLVVYGGVAAQRAPDSGASAPPTQKALGDVLALPLPAGTWNAPDVIAAAAGGPGPRAFHAAATAPAPGTLPGCGGTSVVVFGGHILTLEAATGRKRRIFFNDLWRLDVVREQHRGGP
jgi:hypothetical protein